jgi:hypothetical protein
MEFMRNPRGIIHAEFARKLTCKLGTESARTSTESAQTSTDSARTDTESVCTFTGKFRFRVVCAESVRNTWGSVKYWGCGTFSEILNEYATDSNCA